MAKPQAKSKVAPREAVLVLGMYASGTSALTRVANLLGAAVPPLLVGGEDRAHSGWQSAKLVALNEEMLAAQDSAADDWRPLEHRWRDPSQGEMFAERIREAIADEYGNAQLFVLTDPRLCRNLPFWMSALEAANIRSAPLILVRNPLEVAHSLSSRGIISSELAHLLWLRHYLDAEFETRHLSRNVITYDALVEDWRSIVVQSAGRLAINWPRTPAEANADIRAFLSHDLHHQRASKAELHASSETPALVKEAYEALTRLCDEPKSGYAKRELDKIRAAFNDSCRLFGTVAFADRAHAKACEAEAHAADARAATADALTLEVERLTKISEAHDELQLTHMQSEEQIKELEAALAQSKDEHAVASEAADDLEKRADGAEKHIAELLNMISELEAREATSQEALAEATAVAAELRNHAHELIDRIERIEGEIRAHAARGTEVAGFVDEAMTNKITLLASLQSGLLSTEKAQEELNAARAELTTHQSSALEAAADARKLADELESAKARIAELETKAAEARAAKARAKELQNLVENAQTSALRSSDDVLRANEAAAELQRAARDADARAQRLEDELRFQRIHVMALEKRLTSWVGIIGAAMRKVSGLSAKPAMKSAPLPALAPPKAAAQN